MATLTIGQSAPAFSLNGIDGQSHSLNASGARLTLAVFFKTTCPTCMMAFPYIEKLHLAFKDAGLAVWGVSQDGRDVATNFASQYQSTFPVLIDADWHVSRQYDPQFVPTLFLIDSAGTIADCLVAFDKAGLNRIAATVALRLGAPRYVVASDTDGNPPFKPG